MHLHLSVGGGENKEGLSLLYLIIEVIEIFLSHPLLFPSEGGERGRSRLSFPSTANNLTEEKRGEGIFSPHSCLCKKKGEALYSPRPRREEKQKEKKGTSHESR